MTNDNKSAESLSPHDFTRNPVWRFSSNSKTHETHLRPIKHPVQSLAECVIGVKGRLASGRTVDCVVGNVSARNVLLNEHVPTLSVWIDGKWFHMARYWDPDYGINGPDTLSIKLGESLPGIFPIIINLTGIIKGPDAVKEIRFTAEPKNRMTEREIIREIVKNSIIE